MFYKGGTTIFYDYCCKKCEIIKEVRHGMTKNPKILCECGEVMVKIISGGCGFVLRGRGWSSKNNATASKPKHYKEVGIKVDNDKRKEMQAAGEKV